MKSISFIIFGGTGDLTKRKLIPAIYNLVQNGKIEANSLIVGIGRKDYDDGSYRNYLIDGLKEEDRKKVERLNIKYFRGDVSDKDKINRLREFLDKNEQKKSERVFYLATSYTLFPSIINELKEQGLNEGVKIVFEKPFGKDLESSNFIDMKIHESFMEEQVYRIDHYVAKETVQNINILKFTNPILYNSFCKELIDSIEIVVDEDLGVGNRIEYYRDAGALKDMIQNHLLQILSLVLMEMPSKLDSENIHAKKIEILKNLELGNLSEFVLGQYQEYKEEAEKAGVQFSKIETFAKVVLNCRLERWNGVKLILRTGKKLERKYGQIKINFKKQEFESGFEKLSSNKIIIDIYPKQDIKICMNTIHPEKNKELESVMLKFSRESTFGPNTSDEYATLLNELIKTDRTLFIRSEEVKESWKILENIEKMRDKIKFVTYSSEKDLENL